MDKEDNKRVYWACRRGMLELDLFLIPFFEKYYDTLTHDEKLSFSTLLTATDPEIFSWLMGHQVPENASLLDIVKKIRLCR